MRYILLPVLGAGLLVFANACSSSNTTGVTGGGAGLPGTCPDNLAKVENSEFCEGNRASPNCDFVSAAYSDQVCGVPVLAPTQELTRSANVKEYAGSGPPDLSCLAPGNYPVAGASKPVTMKGVATIFSHGCESKDLTIEVFKVKRTGGADDGDLGELVGTAVVTPSDCKIDGLASEEEDCGTRYECRYTYPNIPSETELLIRTSGSLWAPLYDYNIYIPNTALTGADEWEHDVRALAADDYSVISQAAIGRPITPGNGAIAGEVHDCGDVRLIGAKVDTEAQKTFMGYFTSNEDNPLPEQAATFTGTTALYSALDIVPGPASVAAVGLVGGKMTTIGYYRVRVFPDAVTSMTFRGVRPFQVAAQ